MPIVAGGHPFCPWHWKFGLLLPRNVLTIVRTKRPVLNLRLIRLRYFHGNAKVCDKVFIFATAGLFIPLSQQRSWMNGGENFGREF